MRVAVVSVLLFGLGLLCFSCSSGSKTRIPGFAPDSWETDALDDAAGIQPTGPCSTDNDCQQGVCIEELGACGQCQVDQDCPEAYVCQEYRCMKSLPCVSDTDCPVTGQSHCDNVAGLCVLCLENLDCGPAPWTCVNGACFRGCTGDRDCPDAQVCDGVTGLCVDCVNDGDCDAAEFCSLDYSACIPDICEPGTGQCAGETVSSCRDNGSGWNPAELCPAGSICAQGQCVEGLLCAPGSSVCKDLYSLNVCSSDGKQYNMQPCGKDETCADGKCIPAGCVPDCTNRTCGTNGCGGSCGDCTAGYSCSNAGACICQPNCANRKCGSDGCSGSCGTCTEGTFCDQYGQCGCQPNCAGKQCGSNGCGGTCGGCPAGTQCNQAGQCLCVASCGTRECGPDGCNGSCGECAGNGICNNGQCWCQEECSDKECGDDGCGGSCGDCWDNETCFNGQCIHGEVSCMDLVNCGIDCEFEQSCEAACLAGASQGQITGYVAVKNCVKLRCHNHPNSNCYWDELDHWTCEAAANATGCD